MIKSKNRKSMSINEYEFLKNSFSKSDLRAFMLSQLKPIGISKISKFK